MGVFCDLFFTHSLPMSALQQSKLRIHWATEKVENLKFSRETVYNDAMQAVADDPHLKSEEVYFLFRNNLFNITIKYISEFVLHSRAALDYIIFVLARRDAGNEFRPDYDRTQFPIEKTEEKFTANRKTFLRHLTDEHVALIEKFQPYNGFQSLLLLNRLSNIDKHREFIRPNFQGRVGEVVVPVAQTQTTDAIAEMKMESRHTFQILLDDGNSVEESLAKIVSEVTQIVNYFDRVLR